MTVERVTHRASERIDADTIAGKQLYTFKKTLSGSAPHTVTLADHGVPDMLDANYTIHVSGEFAAATSVDESTITSKLFNLIGGANGEIAHITVIGYPNL